jgi:putative MFS transporter
MPAMTAPTSRAAKLAVLVAALGYFVDIYDLILFSAIRPKALPALGVPPAEMQSTGIYLLNIQMWGMLLGGILWGVLGDRRGRLSVLFGSIILYSLANFANGMVDTVSQFAWCRFIAGIGLAGELGAGITLVSEVLSRERRGWGTSIVAAVGLLGGVAATLVAGAVPALTEGMYWRHAFYLGGALGFALLVLRVGVVESGMYKSITDKKVSRGNLLALVWPPARGKRYLAIIIVGVPIWCVIGVLMTFSPEIGEALGLGTANPKDADPGILAPTSLMLCYAGAALGDIASGALSQLLRSRKKTLAIFLGLVSLNVLAYFTLGALGHTAFYAIAFSIGFASGYWAVFVTTSAEQFGTNLRATATTTTPNFVRGSVPLVTMLYQALSGSWGRINAAITTSVLCLALAFLALFWVHESFGKDLDFTED